MLTGKNFGKRTKTTKSEKVTKPNFDTKTIAYYHSPTCPYCRKFQPTYDKLQKNITNIVFTKVNVNKYEEYYSDLFNELKLRGVPSLVKFHRGKKEVYSGNRTYEDIYNWINK